MNDPGLDKFLSEFSPPEKRKAKKKGATGRGRWPDGAVTKTLKERTELPPDAPAPHLEALVAENGAEPTADALRAWNDRIQGVPIIDVAHNMGVSIELAKSLINEVHAAVREDLKANLELNRNLDLHRIDSLLLSYLPAAKAGDDKAASIVIKALQHRAKLTGQEVSAEPVKSTHVENVQAWIVGVLPQINRLVDDMPRD